VGPLLCICAIGLAQSGFGQGDRIEQLITELNDANRTVRLGAVRALAETKDPRAGDPLYAIRNDPDPVIRGFIDPALYDVHFPGAVDLLIASTGRTIPNTAGSIIDSEMHARIPNRVPDCVDSRRARAALRERRHQRPRTATDTASHNSHSTAAHRAGRVVSATAAYDIAGTIYSITKRICAGGVDAGAGRTA
jgi:hypothetical protein